MDATLSENLPSAAHHISTDLTADAGPAKVDGDVIVEGSVRDGAVLEAGGSATIRGMVESARIDATGNIEIQGGIVGKRKGHISGRRTVSGKFCTGATVHSLGDIQIETEIAHSILIARGAVRIPHGVISGGRMTANAGIECRTMGTANNTATDVGVGYFSTFDEAAEADVNKLQAILDQARSVRDKVEPLMKQQKTLTPAQKEKAIELLYEASESEQRAAQGINDMWKTLQEIESQACAEITVHDKLFGNVTVRFRGAYATTNMDFKGPLKLTLGRQHNLPAVCLTELESGKSCFLETTIYHDPMIAVRGTLRDWLNSNARH